MSEDYLEDSKLKSLQKAEDLDQMIAGILSIINVNKAIVDVKVDELYYRSGKNRSQLSESDMQRLIDNDFDNIEELPAIQITTEKSYRIVCDYINSAPGNRAKAIVVKLLRSGEIPDLMKRFENYGLTIEREDISLRLSNYLDSIESRVNMYYDNFFALVPDAKKLNMDRSRLVFNADITNIVRSYAKITKSDGSNPSQSEIQYFNDKLVKLRRDVSNVISPELGTALEIMGMPPTTYKSNIKKAEGELYKQILLS